VPYWQRDSWTDSDLVDSGYFSEESQSQAALCPRILGTAGLIYTARLPPWDDPGSGLWVGAASTEGYPWPWKDVSNICTPRTAQCAACQSDQSGVQPLTPQDTLLD
jgi:hypothetical protein